MSKLVIVESPAKAKTIGEYLGKDYNVIASMGHIRDLPKSKLGVDIEDNFKPKYSIIRGKSEFAKELKKLAKKSDCVFLATDPDREGEAISWHIANILKLNLDEKNRVTFNEITKTGVKKGMDNPRKVDMDLVNAQQARRILDRLVGYKLSPFLSQKIRRGLSAGRVQSVAVRIIVDRENEIRNFKSKEYWTIDAKFIPNKGSRKQFAAQFFGNKDGKIEISNEAQADKILKDLYNANYIVSDLKKGERKKYPAPPFITSTLQQDASRKLGFQPRKTMKIAQELYEGIEIDNIGAVGLITYMRTDSLRISNEAINESRDYILKKWGNKYLPKKERVFKSRKDAQDAHEAIRPTTIDLTPESIKKNLSSEQYKLYKIIWDRFVASQMSDCVLDTTQVEVTANNYVFKASGYTVKFDGFTILYVEGKDESVEKAKSLPELEIGMELKLKNIEKNQHFTQPPARFTEASLIKTLEENGIGRPSTYAATISTITSREYVIKEGKSLKPTELGETITTLLKDKFPDIVNTKFTADMETDLDTIEEGKSYWVDILKNFYDGFEENLNRVKEDMKGVKIKLKEDETDIICEKCGRKMVIKIGKYGKFIACPGYPECKNIKKLEKNTGAECPKCGGSIVQRKSKKGKIFFGCNKYPDCDFVSWDEPVNEKCPKCGKTLFKKNGKNTKLYCKTENCGYEKTLISDKESKI